MSNAIFTVCNLAYLPKALVLAQSLWNTNAIRLKIYLVDRKNGLDLALFSPELIWIEDCGVPDFPKLAFKFDITELSTSIKPFLSLQLLEQHEKIIFLDPDICVYDNLAPIFANLDEHGIILTPHYTIPHGPDNENSDLGMMRFGSFNLGFFAVSRAPEAREFLSWWSDRCIRYCYFETQFGLSTDQKWATIVPCFFRDLLISFDLGYNVAFWNIQERFLTQTPEGKYLVNNEFPLLFFHYSSFDEAHPEILSKRPFHEKEKGRTDFLPLARAYAEALADANLLVPHSRYGFDFMSGGEYISPTLRRAYACVLDELPIIHDPFDSQGIVGAFAKRNHLFERGNDLYVPRGYGDMASHGRKFAFVYACMRLVLRVIGPNRFSNFSRLLVFLSSYRQTRELWKL